MFASLTLLNCFPSFHSTSPQSLGNDKFNAACGEGVNYSSPMSTLLRQPSSPSMLAFVDSGVGAHAAVAAISLVVNSIYLRQSR